MAIRLAAFDMDGTLVDVVSSWAEVHRYFGESNREALDLFLADRITDEEFLKSDLALWQKHRPELTEGELRDILGKVPLMPGAPELFRALRARGVRTAIVSGGIDLLAERVGRELGIDRVFANGFRADARGRLTGAGVIRVPIKRKERVLEELQHQLAVAPEETAAVGNSAIDIGLFRRARVTVAFLPEDEEVRRAASVVVLERDLTRLLPVLTDQPPAAIGIRPQPGQAF